MPTKPVSRGTFVRNLFASIGAALSGGFVGSSLFGRREEHAKSITVTREPRTVARRDA
jgi:hypothetical protein